MSRRGWPIVTTVLIVFGLTFAGCAENEPADTTFPPTSTVTLPEQVPGTPGAGGEELDRILQDPEEYIDQEVNVSGTVVATFEDDPYSFIMGIPGATMTRGEEPRYFVLVMTTEEITADGVSVGQTAEVTGEFIFYTGHALLGRANPLGLEAWQGRPAIVATEVSVQ